MNFYTLLYLESLLLQDLTTSYLYYASRHPGKFLAGIQRLQQPDPACAGMA